MYNIHDLQENYWENRDLACGSFFFDGFEIWRFTAKSKKILRRLECIFPKG